MIWKLDYNITFYTTFFFKRKLLDSTNFKGKELQIVLQFHLFKNSDNILVKIEWGVAFHYM